MSDDETSTVDDASDGDVSSRHRKKRRYRSSKRDRKGGSSERKRRKRSTSRRPSPSDDQGRSISETDSSRSSDDDDDEFSTSSSEKRSRRKKHRHHKSKKTNRESKSKSKSKKQKSKKLKKSRKRSNNGSDSSEPDNDDTPKESMKPMEQGTKPPVTALVNASDVAGQDSSNLGADPDSIPVPNDTRRKIMAPMSREQYEKEQSIIREVYDEESGRWRLVRGSGEIIERIVSRDDHQRINQRATKSDGSSFSKNVYNVLHRR